MQQLSIPELSAPLEIRRSSRATRLTLRVDPICGVIRVTAPLAVSEQVIRIFVERHASWVSHRQAALPPAQPFVAGAVTPILGRDYVIRHQPELIGGPLFLNQEILVGGKPEHMARRVRDALIALARRELETRTRDKATKIERRVAAITVRDTRSRWGSCSSSGRLSFSWRLILMPDWVMDYVAAHEVAHLAEMNHSPKFWALVGQLTPQVNRPRNWLKTHGTQIMRYGTDG
ncbi:DUF45 domain-containing protein [Azospirillaceae bacterium]